MLLIKPSVVVALSQMTTMFRLISSFSAPGTVTLSKIHRHGSRATAARHRSLSILFSTTDKESSPPKPIPTILLAGFLGAGKTTTLKHLLENNQQIRIGTIVNDVASVNIDAKLIANSDSITTTSKAEGVIELQNGCACCSLADELMDSVMQLTGDDGTGQRRELDAIVVELSGVADPVSVKDNWEMARMQGHPATKLASLQRTVTLIDASTFGTDWMTWDTAGDRPSWTEPGDDCSGQRKIPELLAEQVEAADLLLVNKVDLAGDKQVKIASGLAMGLNEKAQVVEVNFGSRCFFNSDISMGVFYIPRVEAKDFLGTLEILKEELDHGHSHDHGHEHAHGHEDENHSHSHSHEHSAESSCADPECTDTSHSHSHDHSEASCADPDCTDPSHSHSHDHKSSSTATDQLGISSFVYKASTPFNSQRLLTLLNRWPLPVKDSLDFGLVMGSDEVKEGEEPEHQAFNGVLRSKGFCWMAPTKWSGSGRRHFFHSLTVWRHDTAMYWSHAGKHFGIQSAGKWWGTLGKEVMKPLFANNMKEYERILREDWVSEEWGDRRQELVFIGANLDEAGIRVALDECLCTEDEMEMYRMQLRNYLDASLSGENDGPSLFDVGKLDQIDQ
eukprot:CCRYP_002957-RE/>CCRYP_002957-RE protein AED:0.06 eAED:0.06 QI:120/0.25/0.4/1/0.25/0.4/5/0/618